MNDDLYILLIALAVPGIISLAGVFLLVYIACRKPQKYTRRKQLPPQYINRHQSNLLGGSKARRK